VGCLGLASQRSQACIPPAARRPGGGAPALCGRTAAHARGADGAARVRQYTWDKALERWVKSVGMGQDPRKAPTIQSPREYCRRFRTAMAAYLTCVPAGGDVAPPLDPNAGLPE